MTTIDINVPSTLPEEDMSTTVPMGVAVLGQLGLSSLDDQTDQALTATMRRLSTLDEQEPDLGIREQIQTALQSSDPIVAIGRVLDLYRDRLAA